MSNLTRQMTTTHYLIKFHGLRAKQYKRGAMARPTTAQLRRWMNDKSIHQVHRQRCYEWLKYRRLTYRWKMTEGAQRPWPWPVIDVRMLKRARRLRERGHVAGTTGGHSSNGSSPR